MSLFSCVLNGTLTGEAYKINTAREQLNLTQEQLAERVDKKRTFISKVENDGENITMSV